MIDNIFLDPNWKIRGRTDDEIIAAWEEYQQNQVEDEVEYRPLPDFILDRSDPKELIKRKMFLEARLQVPLKVDERFEIENELDKVDDLLQPDGYTLLTGGTP